MVYYGLTNNKCEGQTYFGYLGGFCIDYSAINLVWYFGHISDCQFTQDEPLSTSIFSLFSLGD